ncbi:MAG: DUF2752 domain-containing protein [Ktedonobacteraceae bacterium]|nr:DUF2752 domain-containing protein [Ktedonobacteraceae bacterium]
MLLPAAFFLLSPAWLERQPSLCLSQLVFKRTCPGCGITRALAWSLHGEFGRAWRSNKRIIVVLPLLGLVWLRTIVDGWRDLLYLRELRRIQEVGWVRGRSAGS